MRRDLFSIVLLAGWIAACGGDPTVTVDGGADGTDGGPDGADILVIIERPDDGDRFAPGETIEFRGRATDQRTGEALPSAALVWSSDAAGQIGLGARVATALPEGEHRITLSAAAEDGATGSASISLSVAVPPLEVRILRPDDRAIFPTGQTITFECEARAGGNRIQGAEYRWSTADGQIGLGDLVQTALPDGSHLVTCEATDPASGASAGDSVRITVGEPALRILDPADGEQLTFGETITFRSQIISSDPAPHQVIWRSDVDGQLGIGQSIATALASAGAHRISATFTDAGGRIATDAIEILYLRPNLPPQVRILAPAQDGSEHPAGQVVALSGEALDEEDGDVSAAARWSDPVSGDLGTGPTASIPAALPGKYLVTFEAQDLAGATGRAQRLLYVVPTGAPLAEVFEEGRRIDGLAAAQAGLWTAGEGGFVLNGSALSPAEVSLPSGAGARAVSEGGDRTAFGSTNGLSVCTGGPGDWSCTSYRDVLDRDLDTRVRDLLVLEDGTVIAATSQGILIVDADGGTTVRDGDAWNGADRVDGLAVGPDGRVWLATEEGLVSYDPASGEFDRLPRAGLADTSLRDVAVGPDGAVWVAHGEGVSRFDGQGGWANYGREEGLAESNVLAVAVDGAGIVWGGTDGGGAFRLDPAIGRFLMITTDDGLPSNVVRSVLVEPEVKWFGTDAGLFAWRGR